MKTVHQLICINLFLFLYLNIACGYEKPYDEITLSCYGKIELISNKKIKVDDLENEVYKNLSALFLTQENLNKKREKNDSVFPDTSGAYIIYISARNTQSKQFVRITVNMDDEFIVTNKNNHLYTNKIQRWLQSLVEDSLLNKTQNGNDSREPRSKK